MEEKLLVMRAITLSNFNLIAIVLFCCFLFSGCGVSVSKMDVAKLNQKAAVYMEQGDYDSAIARLIAINDLEDNHPEVYYNLGIAYIKKEDSQKNEAKESTNLKGCLGHILLPRTICQ